MATTIRYKQSALAAGFLLLSLSMSSTASPGLATRDLNPLLQPIYLPRYSPMILNRDWQVSHSVFITNTSQREIKADEVLKIDVENYRYELGFSYRNKDWVFHSTVPLISNQKGELDSLIESWHDVFGLSQGNRDDFARNQIEIQYSREGITEYSQTSASSGLGDIAIVFGYHPLDNQPGFYIGLDLPSGSESDFSGNEATDIALWAIHSQAINPQWQWYGLLGVTLPGNGGALEDLIADQIWVAQLGVDYRFNSELSGIAQLDLHSKSIDDSDLSAFQHSLQLQLGLRFEQLFDDHSLDLFFSEDIDVGTAPDITFGLRIIRAY